MNICSRNHKEIAYDCSNCPLCDANERIEEVLVENRELDDKID